ncbi:MAG: type II toxin-antitoxin system PemK/MazF family toxin [Rhodospirillaceae bacterium]|nr:type II toxin-antitoxin system PemK/MazF family toxin [Rhodospirillaceae bacterium]MYH35427.1 type II toxin-antitoxin system PemK/MazF family toxin [Rhodospirillaceae bacterium]MYJ72846.1 type II toxin-antitoxin system PemK/MazF family toxin [Rhodospirillaceae bacterium]MYK14606.1 type II toxin-antitoxin system PemK/MazF family toxin [Rhodospirillaceae bacterium]
MRRGDLVTVALPGDFGKPRPALVIQSGFFADHTTVTVLPVTTAATDAPLFRLPVDPSPDNGLRQPSFVMVDKAMSIRSEKLGAPFGRLAEADMNRVNRALALFLGIAS